MCVRVCVLAPCPHCSFKGGGAKISVVNVAVCSAGYLFRFFVQWLRDILESVWCVCVCVQFNLCSVSFLSQWVVTRPQSCTHFMLFCLLSSQFHPESDLNDSIWISSMLLLSLNLCVCVRGRDFQDDGQVWRKVFRKSLERMKYSCLEFLWETLNSSPLSLCVSEVSAVTDPVTQRETAESLGSLTSNTGHVMGEMGSCALTLLGKFPLLETYNKTLHFLFSPFKIKCWIAWWKKGENPTAISFTKT